MPFYEAINPPFRKAYHLSLATGDMVCGIAIEYYNTYKLGQKMNLNFVQTWLVFAETVSDTYKQVFFYGQLIPPTIISHFSDIDTV